MFVPLHEGTTTVGVITIQSYTPQAYTLADLSVFGALADQCAGALVRIGIQDALERERQQLRHVIETAPVAMAMFDRDMCYLAHS